MKKVIAVLFIFVLISVCLAGCSEQNSPGSAAADTAGAAEVNAAEDTQKAVENAMEAMETLTNKEWPADKLPTGLPEYTEGEIVNSGGDTDEFYVKIDKTTEAALNAYLEKLKELGWSVEEGRESVASKGVHELRFSWQGKEHLQMALYTTEVGAWPSDKLPPEVFPPDNCILIGQVELLESVPGQVWYTTYTCEGVDEAGAKAYFEKLRSKGWSGDSQLVKQFLWNGKKYSADIELYETVDNTSSFTLNLAVAE